MTQGVVILGATGSIGASTLDVIERHPQRFHVEAVTAQTSVEALLDICARHRPKLAVIGDEGLAIALREGLRASGLPTEAAAGAAALARAATLPGAPIVVAAIVGAAG
ncbi:MAG: 1-deoxy-D-xylulose-5-phosphate reductoisomerase, partial [Burkholderiaceae bacterium]|nr:1-deoxy-D-xylulose-5-phosphate reductoisomerase [Burkholderiaceae bacterium]